MTSRVSLALVDLQRESVDVCTSGLSRVVKVGPLWGDRTIGDVQIKSLLHPVLCRKFAVAD